MPIDKKNLPLNVLVAWADTLKALRKDVAQLDFLAVKNDDGGEFLIVDKDGKFFYRVFSPRFEKSGKPAVGVEYAPQGRNSIDKTSATALMDGLLTHFSTWALNVREYEKISLTEEEEILKQYEKEFCEEYEIVDEDADIAAFEPKKQLYLYNLLTSLQIGLSTASLDDPKVNEITIEAEVLKNNIQNLTKRKVVKAMGKIYAKIQKHGLKLLIDLWDAAKKEGMKRLVSTGIDFLNDQAHNIGGHFHNFGS